MGVSTTMDYEHVDYRVWQYVGDKEMRMQWAEENRQMELGWIEADEQDADDLDVMEDPELMLDSEGIEDFEEGFIRGFTAAA